MIINMSRITLSMCALSVVVWLVENKTKFGKLPKVFRCIIVGVVFGVAAIISTHFGVRYENAVLNVRDMAPLTAGLMFNPWAGVIAGVIGGVERFIAGTYFGVGAFSTVACSVSTLIAGVFAFCVRKFVFEGKKPSAVFSFAIGAIMEVFHMLVLLLSRMDMLNKAFSVVSLCSAPMIAFCAIGMMLTSVLISVLSGEYKGKKIKRSDAETPITSRFQFWLLLLVCTMFVLTFSFTYVVQTRLTYDNTKTLLKVNADDLKRAIISGDKNLSDAVELLGNQSVAACRALANNVKSAGGIESLSSEALAVISKDYDLYEINLVNNKGIIIASTNKNYIGFDLSVGEQSRPFMALITGEKDFLIQDFQPIAFDSSVSVMYVGVSCPGGFIQIGNDESKISDFTKMSDISSIASDRHIGEGGGVLVFDADGNVVSGSAESMGHSKTDLGFASFLNDNEYFFSDIGGAEYYCYSVTISDYTAVIMLPSDEMYQNRNIFAYETAFVEILLFAAIFFAVYSLVHKIIIKNLDRVNISLASITSGNLNETVNVASSSEFTSLSHDINAMVEALKRYIKEAENRISSELEFAHTIQTSALPTVFPNSDEICVFASMNPAKEVGGDFYDFFYIDSTHIALVIADVSGKGIPAALFMMKSKTLIKNFAQSGLSPAYVLSQANDALCEGNDAEMFVTVWIGILDISNGKLTCANAGHEYPAIMKANGEYELLRDKHGLVLGGMEGICFKEYDLELSAGDRLFVYTDGVTEAINSQKILFGNDRLVAALNSHIDKMPQDMLAAVKKDIDEFAGTEPQFDDITMLTLYMKPVRKITIPFSATQGATEGVMQKAETFFDEAELNVKLVAKLNIMLDEILSNIVSYSGACDAQLSIHASPNKITLVFSDDGNPYNPLEKADPDVTESAEERKIGGLGIYMVKNLADSVVYEYREGRNILTVGKQI